MKAYTPDVQIFRNYKLSYSHSWPAFPARLLNRLPSRHPCIPEANRAELSAPQASPHPCSHLPQATWKPGRDSDLLAQARPVQASSDETLWTRDRQWHNQGPQEASTGMYPSLSAILPTQDFQAVLSTSQYYITRVERRERAELSCGNFSG